MHERKNSIMAIGNIRIWHAEMVIQCSCIHMAIRDAL